MVKQMNYFRILTAIYFTLFLFALSGGAQESTSGNTISSPSTDDSNINYNFHKVPSGDNLKVFHDAVIRHIVNNKGIQDFYSFSLNIRRSAQVLTFPFGPNVPLYLKAKYL